MKHTYLFIGLFFFILNSNAQISGNVRNEQGDTVQNVSVFLADSYKGTTTNQQGDFNLKISIDKPIELVFKYLGYKTVRRPINPSDLPVELDIVMQKKTENLDEVVVQPGQNPAIPIIENAIANREMNYARIKSYKADFYSKGLWEVKNVPEKILGREIGDLGGALDSTRSGILYLSETFSKIAYRAETNDFREKITASKISGDDNGFSFNSAQSFEFTFYDNTTEIGADMVSPIADFALNYYDYELEDVFYERGATINKIKVIPKRENDNAYSGHIYLTDETGEIYGVDLKATGNTLNVNFIEDVNFKLNFQYSETYDFWVNISKNILFNFKLLGIDGSGYFVGNYTNYKFQPDFGEDFFTAETTSFTKDANKKDSLFWVKNRPVELTEKEINDYVKKDSIQKVRGSKTYKDSIDKKNNKFKWLDPLTGYSHQNSITKNYWGFDGFGTSGVHFNTVQGFNIDTGIYYLNRDSINPSSRYWRVDLDANYGRADQRLRISGSFEKKFNNFSKPILRISGGTSLNQINRTNPIQTIVADVAAVAFEENFLKLYEQRFASIYYKEEILNGLRLQTRATYQERVALTNSRNEHVFGYNKGGFTSNDPTAPNAFGSILFPEHTNLELSGSFRYRFGQTYRRTPNGKFNNFNPENPEVTLAYRTGLAASEDGFNYALFKTNVTQEVGLSNKGNFKYSANAGLFLDGDNINFLDYQHFNGNETPIGDGSRYMDQFHLLPYYSNSTNQEFAHFHAEQNFEGYIMNKLPLLKKLGSELVIGGKTLLTDGSKPYSEATIGLDNLGFGIFRFFRIDYVRSFQQGKDQNGLMVGIKILDSF